MSRIDYIDKAKGFAICAVVTGHVLVYDLYSFEKAWNISNLTQFIYSFHMSLFIRVCFRYSYKRKCLAWYMETFQDSHYPLFCCGQCIFPDHWERIWIHGRPNEIRLLVSSWFESFLTLHSNFILDLCFTVVPTCFAITISLGIKKIMPPILLRYVFSKQ